MQHVAASHIIWLAIWAGIFGTAGMEILLQSITKSGMANADMARAIGSLFTKKFQNAYGIGITVQTINGIVFAFLYTIVIVYFQVHGFLSSTGAGALIGFIHGAVVGFILVAVVAENHPLKEFKEAGFSVAVAHWAGHLVYGLIVGAVIGLMGY